MKRSSKPKFNIKSMSRTMKNILNSRYRYKTLFLENKLIEINSTLKKEYHLNQNELNKISEKFEPIMHIHGNCFLVSSLKHHTFGVMNFKTREIILPCKYNMIEFGKYSDLKSGRLLDAIDIFGNIQTFLINELAEPHIPSSNKKIEIINNIAKKHKFITSVDISKASEII